MARIKNTMGTIREMRGKINARYDVYSANFDDILENSNHPVDLIRNGFTLGYVQGMKAAKAEMRKA